MKRIILSTSLLIVCLSAKSQSFMAPNYVPEYSPYQSKVDIKLYERVITEKQNAYDNNLKTIKDDIKQLNEYLYDLSEINYDDYKFYYVSFNKWLNETINSNPDLSQKQTAQKILDTITLYTQLVRKSIRESR